MIKNIIFDFDGVLVNTYEHHYQSSAKKYKNFDRETHKKLFDGNIHELKGNLEIENPEIDVSSLLREGLLKQKIEKNVFSLIKKLKNEGCNLFIITSHRESILNEFFEKENLGGFFNEVLGEETHIKKDVKFNLLMQKYKFNSNECLFITDTLGDLKEANKVGIKSIGVTWGFHEKKRLERGQPVKIVDTFFELSGVLDK